jgi:hypothetical protein
MTTEERLSTEDLVAPKAADERPDTESMNASNEASVDDRTSQMQDDRTSQVPDDDTSQAGSRDDSTSHAQRQDERVELFSEDEIERFRGRWQSLQTAFVDDPRDTVQGADQLVAEVMQALASTFADHKRDLETQWQQGEEVATEDLRLALQRYRTFFNELLRN